MIICDMMFTPIPVLPDINSLYIDRVNAMQVGYGLGHEHAEACRVTVRVLHGRPDAGVSHYGAGPKLILPDCSDLSLALPSYGKCQEPPVGHGGIDIHADL